jgi:hypothetical protein
MNHFHRENAFISDKSVIPLNTLFSVRSPRRLTHQPQWKAWRKQGSLIPAAKSSFLCLLKRRVVVWLRDGSRTAVVNHGTWKSRSIELTYRADTKYFFVMIKSRDSYSHIFHCIAFLLTASVVCRSRGPGFDSQRYQVFWEVVGLEWGPRSLVSINEELLEWKNNSSGSRKPRLTDVGIRCADHATPSIRKIWH